MSVKGMLYREIKKMDDKDLLQLIIKGIPSSCMFCIHKNSVTVGCFNNCAEGIVSFIKQNKGKGKS